MTETLPASVFVALLKDQWDEGNVKMPTILEVNVPSNAVLRFDLTRGDVIFVRSDPTSVVYTYRNAYNYYDKRSLLITEMHTKESRQRLYDIMGEIRRVCEVNTHSITGYQLLKFMNFTEFTTEELNIWRGTASVHMESAGVRSSYTVSS